MQERSEMRKPTIFISYSHEDEAWKGSILSPASGAMLLKDPGVKDPAEEIRKAAARCGSIMVGASLVYFIAGRRLEIIAT